ncbi:EamA family transporter [Amycolatopsis rhabdoformis]|uniref:EamA family transporter n=1 Tax=Amycolatopsis rhabdoformis TaxID=1448059 RepID=A0ABZ1I8I0_9PSEU|nr:EamA family transporter [Amycolatopsis rhabdoformis]WSE30687.1 EamA family transporter [Amycolatopsis rhabdoformis]
MSVVLSERARGSVALVVAGVLWGSGGLAGSLLGQLAGLHPLAVAAYRLLLGGAAAIALSGKGIPRTRAALRRVLVVGALFAFFQTTYFAAVALGSVGTATMTTIGAAPVMLTLATAIRTRRAPHAWTLLSTLGALAGLALLCWEPHAGTSAAATLLALAAAAGFATLTTRPVEDPLATTAYGCLTGGLLLTPAALTLGMTLPARPEVLLVAAYFALVPTALAYAAYFRGLTTAHPVLGALSALLEPLTATILSVVFLREHLSAQAWCGAALLAGALVVGYWRPEPRSVRAAGESAVSG